MNSFEETKGKCKKKFVNKNNTTLCLHSDYSKYRKDVVCSNETCPFFKTHPIISYGKQKSKISDISFGGLTEKQLKVYRLKVDHPKITFVEIGEQISTSGPNAYKLYTKALKKLGGLTKHQKNKKRGLTKSQGGLTKGVNKKPHMVSLHNDSIGLSAEVDFNAVKGEIKHLKYCDYKLIKNEKTVLKVYSNMVVVQFRKEIIEETVEKAEDKAKKRIYDFISKIKVKGIKRISKVEQLQRHYAIIGTEVAKKYIREGKRLLIYEPTTNKLALTIDYSDKDKKGGMPHLETPHVEKGKEYIDRNKRYIEDITFNEHYLPSEQKAMFDNIMSIQQEHAYNIKSHLEVMNNISKNAVRNNEIQDETLKTLKAIQESLSK